MVVRLGAAPPRARHCGGYDGADGRQRCFVSVALRKEAQVTLRDRVRLRKWQWLRRSWLPCFDRCEEGWSSDKTLGSYQSLHDSYQT